LHDDRRITEVRLDRFLRDRIAPAVYPRSLPLTLSSWEAPDEPVPALEALRHEFTPQEHGAAWGRPWSTKWLRLQGEVPQSWGTTPGTSVEIQVDLGFGGELPGCLAVRRNHHQGDLAKEPAHPAQAPGRRHGR